MRTSVAIRPRLIELSAFTTALIAANFMLLIGRVCDPLVFLPDRFLAGDWWRALTFPFVHVSWYHLLLDAGAFLFLYHGLQETSAKRRLTLVATCAAGSLGASWVSSPLSGGLCGLSGIAHGLMAVSALEIMRSTDRSLRNAGIICFITVVLKSIYEACAATVAFQFLHFGFIGEAVAVSHAGGILGGLIAYGIRQKRKG